MAITEKLLASKSYKNMLQNKKDRNRRRNKIAAESRRRNRD